SVGDMYGDPFADPYPGFDPAHIGYVFRFTLKPRQTTALVTFVVKGLSEIYGSRGGATIPEGGSRIARGPLIARKRVGEPDLRGLTALQRSQIANWTLPAPMGREGLSQAFSVVEKTTDEIQAALIRGITTSEDVVREYLQRLTMYDRNGPGLRAMLALNPR